jgi:hypothetical protein
LKFRNDEIIEILPPENNPSAHKINFQHLLSRTNKAITHHEAINDHCLHPAMLYISQSWCDH